MAEWAPEAASAAQQLALWADRLRDLAAMGLRFSDNVYDEERYSTVETIAMEMLAVAAVETPEAMEPLRAPVLSRPTPMVGGEGAVIDDAGQILLIRRADNGLWAMPGGALEVGETPVRGVQREVLEETGVKCEPAALVGVYDSRRCGSPSRHHYYLLSFVLRPVDGILPVEPSHPAEILDLGWFGQDGLPEAIHPGTLLRIDRAYWVWSSRAGAEFDR